MKLYFFKHQAGDEFQIKEDKDWNKLFTRYILVGEIELQEPKKTVVREAECVARYYCQNEERLSFKFPQGARNKKCTFEVEE